MNKKQAIKEFREFILPTITERYGRYDRDAKFQAFSNYIDALSKDNRITGYQADTWTNIY